jgi:soluble lytic murein transglycosylase-like protein
VVCLALAVAAWLATGPGSSRPRAPRPDRRASTQRPSPPGKTRGRAGSAQVAADLNLAERVIHDPGAAPRALAWAGLAEEIGTGILEREPVGQRRATLALTDPQARASLRTDLAAAAALAGLAERRTRLPPWRIIAPPPAPTLLRLFRTAQARFGVPWPYLAAIELVETRFGRIRGPSSAGAQGPMQFLPATWARYGRGSINNPRDAIMAAARLLAANGAPAHMAGALRHYNDSQDYVAAVTDYARRMGRDPRAYYGYETWQVIYTYDHRTVILPVGFPATGAAPLPHHLPPASPAG